MSTERLSVMSVETMMSVEVMRSEERVRLIVRASAVNTELE